MEELDKSTVNLINDESEMESSKEVIKEIESQPLLIENGDENVKNDENSCNVIKAVSSLTPDIEKLIENLKQAQKDKEEVMDDRDSLFKILERRTLEIERLENNVKVLKEQLASAFESKHDALLKFDEIQHRSKQIEFKEKLFEQDKLAMEAQIEALTADLNRNMQELQHTRKESTTQKITLEAKLHEISEELKISTRQLTQFKETNVSLTSQVEELSDKLLKFNETYASTVQKYQQELKSKTRLSELYKEKNEDVINEQKNISNVVSELRNALKQATEEFGALETSSKQKEHQYEQEREEMMKLIESLQTELKNARKENIETSIEKLMNPMALKRLSGKSITEIFTLYIQSADDLETLNAEHEQLKFSYNELIQEIKEKGPQIKKSQIEHERLKNTYETLKIQFDILQRERFETNFESEALLNEIRELRKSLTDAQKDRQDLGKQICYLLEKSRGNTGSRRESCDSITFDSIEELQDNNIKLVALVRDLSAAIEKLQSEEQVKKNIINILFLFFLIFFLMVLGKRFYLV